MKSWSFGRFALALSLLLGGVGCALEPDVVIDDEGNEALTSNALTSNALTSNALTSNALTSNALTSNALTSNALTSNALTSNALTSESLDDPHQGRKAASVIRYSARCMLRPDQSVTITYRLPDGTQATDTYWGNLGLEPTWTDGSLTASGRRWWAACLGAHINAFGVPVSVSVRGPHPSLTITAVEADDYTIREGAFWADYDPDANPALHIYSCYDSANSAAALARSRICANESCGEMMTVVGECLAPQASACESEHPLDATVGDYLEGCHPSQGPGWADQRFDETVTANLKL